MRIGHKLLILYFCVLALLGVEYYIFYRGKGTANQRSSSILLFTTCTAKSWSKDPSSKARQMSAFRNWAQLPNVDVLVFTDEQEVEVEATKYGFFVSANFHVNAEKLVLWNSLWTEANARLNAQKAHYAIIGYSNSDILFTPALSVTLAFVRGAIDALDRNASRPFLVTGQRWNIDPPENGLPLNVSFAELESLVNKTGSLYTRMAQDWFFARPWTWMAGFPTDYIPDFCVPLVAADNWMVGRSFVRPDMESVDATATVLAIHLNHGTTRGESHKSPCNKINVAIGKEWHDWHVVKLGAQLRTHWRTESRNGSLVLVPSFDRQAMSLAQPTRAVSVAVSPLLRSTCSQVIQFDELVIQSKCLISEQERLSMHDKRNLAYADLFVQLGEAIVSFNRSLAGQLFARGADLYDLWTFPNITLALRAHALLNDSVSYRTLGRTYRRLGHFKEAALQFYLAARADLTDSDSCFDQGMLLVDLNTYDSRAASLCSFSEALSRGKLTEPDRSAAQFYATQPLVPEDYLVLERLESIRSNVISLEQERAEFVSRIQTSISRKVAPILRNAKRMFLLDYPDHANAGDAAIWWGEIELLSQFNITLVPWTVPCKGSLLPLHDLISEGDIIGLHGGGNFGDKFSVCNTQFRAEVAASFKRNPILVFSQTMVPWRKAMRYENTSIQFEANGNVTVMARDAVTFLAMQQMFNRTPVVGVPDMAFWIPFPLMGEYRCNESAPKILWLGRSDKEKRGLNPINEPDVEVLDWFGADDSHPNKSVSYDEQAKYSVRRAFRILSRGQVVVTDRLHAHILSTLLGKPHVIMDNSYGKIRQFYQTWSKWNPYSFPAANPVEALRLGRLLVRNFDKQTNTLRLTEELVHSKNLWLQVPGVRNSFLPPADSLLMQGLRIAFCGRLTAAKNLALPPWTAPSRFSNQLQERLARMPGRDLILTFANAGYIDFALNWATSLSRIGLRNYLIVAQDLETYVSLSEHGLNAFFASCAYVSGATAVSSKFMSHEFKDLMRFRSWVVPMVLNWGYNVLFSDTDVLIMQDPFPFFRDRTTELFLTSDDARYTKGNTTKINGGFFFARSTLRVRTLFSDIFRIMLQNKHTVNDQTALVNAVRTTDNLSYALLDELLFINGFLMFENGSLLKRPPVAVHNNWVVGVANKRHRLRENHLWFIESDTYFNRSARYLSVQVATTDTLLQWKLTATLFTIAKLSNRIVVLPTYPRSDVVSMSDSFERYFDVEALDQHLPHGYRAHGFLQDSRMGWLSPCTYFAFHSEAQIPEVRDLSTPHLCLDVALSFAMTSALESTLLQLNPLIFLRADALLERLRAKRAVSEYTTCVRVNNVSSEIESAQHLLRSYNSSQFVLSVPQEQRQGVSLNLARHFLHMPPLPPGDPQLVLLEVVLCSRTEQFLSSPSLFKEVVCSMRHHANERVGDVCFE